MEGKPSRRSASSTSGMETSWLLAEDESAPDAFVWPEMVASLLSVLVVLLLLVVVNREGPDDLMP